MPRLSILIPCLGPSAEFEDTLVSVLQNRPHDCEVILAHASDYADPYRLSGEVCLLQVPEARQHVTLLNAGFEAARSSIVHVVQCGLEVAEGWVEPALECFSEESVATVAPIIVDGESGNRVVSAGLGFSHWGRTYASSAGQKLGAQKPLAAEIVGPTLAAGFYRRRWWRHVRWNEALGDDFADAQFNLTLAKLGATTRLAANSVLHGSPAQGMAADEPYGFSAARRAERLYWSQQATAGAGKMALRTALSLAEALLALPSPRAFTGVLGRFAALLERGAAEAFEQRVSEIAAGLADEQSQAATISLDQVRQDRQSSRTTRRAA